MRTAGTGSSALLLDTHILVWLGNSSPRLPASVRTILIDTPAKLFMSAVTLSEFADLNQRGRFGDGLSLDVLIDRFEITPLDLPKTVWRLQQTLPDIHRDPIDRMLIAHALHAGLAIVTADATIRRYPVATIW